MTSSIIVYNIKPSLSNYSPFLLAIIVTGGQRKAQRKVEILKADGTPICALPDLPEGRYYHTQSGLVSCGGNSGPVARTSCVTFQKGVWTKTHQLGKKWLWHSSWSSRKHGIILMQGTYTNKIAEKLTKDGRTKFMFQLKAKYK